MRAYFDDAATSIDADSLHAGFIKRGDRAAAAALGPAAERVLAACVPNPGHHLFMQLPGGDVHARVPLRSALIGAGDDIIAALGDCLDTLRERGVALQDGDVILVSEKALSISQRRAVPVDEVRVSPLASLLSRFVTRTPSGVGLGHPVTMELAIREAGRGRIVAAAAAAGVGRLFGKREVFYRIAGHQVNAIDGPSKFNLPPYDTWASLAPTDSPGEAVRIAAAVEQRYGVCVGVAVIDASDLGASVFGATPGVDPEEVKQLVADNPLGQSSEQTPFGLVRRMTAEAPGARTPAEVAREPIPASL
jgi:F420-0:gamma-glutamyl ligase-like protein